ncbi:hypothetical protein AFR_15955 [Actinoplanes friuliensis DSM 7358]|uniref:Uncharacterized protein n=1 Tax=Actinoplanes friuliensis DSM 7358 TaxID=1246995 RepID=U5VWU6_9ACTN|nr:hypothetical protein AFR_15955 [Actinoplanes friuliensis DSM 7358]
MGYAGSAQRPLCTGRLDFSREGLAELGGAEGLGAAEAEGSGPAGEEPGGEATGAGTASCSSLAAMVASFRPA